MSAWIQKVEQNMVVIVSSYLINLLHWKQLDFVLGYPEFGKRKGRGGGVNLY